MFHDKRKIHWKMLFLLLRIKKNNNNPQLLVHRNKEF